MEPHPPLLLNKTRVAVVGSIQGEQALRLSHIHPLYRDYNKQFYLILEDANRGTTYEASIKPFLRAINVRGAYLAMIDKHAGREKLIITLQDAKYCVNNRR